MLSMCAHLASAKVSDYICACFLTLLRIVRLKYCFPIQICTKQLESAMGEKNIVIPRKDFPYFFSKTLSNLYRSDIFSDIILASENVQFINAHKIILSLSSSAMN